MESRKIKITKSGDFEAKIETPHLTLETDSLETHSNRKIIKNITNWIDDYRREKKHFDAKLRSNFGRNINTNETENGHK